MRWKLQFLIALAMSVVAVLLYAIARRVAGGNLTFRDPFAGREFYLLLLLLIPALAGGFFIYRHTARKRKTQAAITLAFTVVLSMGALLLLGRFH